MSKTTTSVTTVDGRPESPSARSATAHATITTNSNISSLRKFVLLTIFCLAQFLDVFNISALYSAIPALSADLGINASESTWLTAAFQLTFASFLLVSGKISDVYNPKYAFIVGTGVLGVISLGTGFVHDKIVMLVLRALAGIAGSMSIPSALNLLVKIYSEPSDQARAIGIFGGFAAMGNVLGTIIGAIFVQYTSYHWIYFFASIMALAIAAVGIIFIPKQPSDDYSSTDSRASKLRRLDLFGVSILTVALVLLIFALTTATTDGWDSPSTIAPLILSIAAVVAFFLWEKRLSFDNAAIPSSTWFYKNFSILFVLALFPFLWWISVFTTVSTLWQDIYHWSAISTALHMLPLGIAAFLFSFSGSFADFVNKKYVLMSGQILAAVGTILIILSDEPRKYWRFAFPGFIIGSSGTQLTFTYTNIAIFETAPSSMAGTVGAIFNGALQVGAAVGLAVVTSIQLSVEAKIETPEFPESNENYRGRAAGFWFVFAVIVTQLAAVMFFYRSKSSPSEGSDSASVIEQKTSIEVEKEAVENV